MLTRAPGRAAMLLGSTVVLCWVVACPAAALATPTVTEYSAPLIASNPMDVAAGSDGNVWFTENGGGAVGRIAPSGTITDFATPTHNSQPRGITAGPGGNLWFTESGPDKIGRVTPTGVITEFSVNSGLGSPIGITEGSDGNLWFTESGGSGAIERITPTGVVTQFTTGLTPNSAPWYIANGPDGDVWFTEKVNPGRIGKLDPSTGAIAEYSLAASGLPWGITRGPDGNVWFTVGGGGSAIGRITPSGAITEYSAGLTQGFPVGITSGPDGNLYFTEKTGSGAVGRITPSGAITEYTSGLTANSTPQGIVSGADGNIWFAETASPGRLARLGIAGTGGSTSSGDEPSGTSSAPAGTTTAPSLIAGNSPLGSTPSAPTNGAAATPTLGRTVSVAPIRGTLLIQRPGTGHFVPLAEKTTIPVGSTVDATRGTVALTSRRSASGGLQTADFWGGRFRVFQRRAQRASTRITLVGEDFSACGIRPARSAGQVLTALTMSRRPLRQLWGHDNHGNYTTQGRGAVAAVRGTSWLTRDTCAGTLVVVASGKVAVRDLGRHRTVLVRAHHRYLARVP